MWPMDAVRYRFPPPTGLPCDDSELEGFFAELEGIFLVLDCIFLVLEGETEVEMGRCKVG